MTAVANADSNRHIILDMPPIGRLRGVEVRRILDGERGVLHQQVITRTVFCWTLRTMLTRDPLCYKQIPWHTRIYVEILIPAFAYTISYTLLLAFALMSDDEDVDRSWIFFGPLIGGFFGVGILISNALCCFSLFARRSQHSFLPALYYPINLAAIIDRRREMITRYLAHVNDDRCVPAAALARLIASVKLRPATEMELIALASPGEFKIMLDEFALIGMEDIQLSANYKILREMLKSPPTNALEYHERVIRLRPLLQAPEDYQVLAHLLDQDDPRRTYLDPNTLSDADSAETSASTDSMYLDAVGDPPIHGLLTIQGQIFTVDKQKLCEKSSWFASRLCFSVPASALFQNELILIITNLSGIRALWDPSEAAKKDEYIQLSRCLNYYGFCTDADQLARHLFDCGFLSVQEKFVVLNGVVILLNIHNIDLSYWHERLYSIIKQEPTESEQFSAALNFCILHFPEIIIPRYSEYFSSRKGIIFPGIVIKSIALRRELFPTCIESLRLQLREYLNHPQPELDVFVMDADFMSWLGEEMNRPGANMISLSNFKLLWPLKTHDEGIGIALHRFASSNRAAVMRLWDVGSVPDQLVMSLPI